MSTGTPVWAGLTLIVGRTASRPARAIIAPKAIRLGHRPRVSGSRPFGKTRLMPKKATNAMAQPQPLAQAVTASNGASWPDSNVWSGAAGWALPIASPQPIVISSQPTLFVGRWMARYAPSPPNAAKNTTPGRAAMRPATTRPAIVAATTSARPTSGIDRRRLAPAVIGRSSASCVDGEASPHPRPVSLRIGAVSVRRAERSVALLRTLRQCRHWRFLSMHTIWVSTTGCTTPR